MKHLFKNLFIALLFSIAITSCTEEAKEEAAAAVNNVIPSGFTCKVDGVSFTADSSRVNIYNGGFSIMAFKAGTTAFEFNLDNPAIGVHTLTPTGREQAAYVAGQVTHLSQAGTITVSTLDSSTATTSGIFTFVALSISDSTIKNITEGSFSVK